MYAYIYIVGLALFYESKALRLCIYLCYFTLSEWSFTWKKYILVISQSPPKVL